MQTFDWIVVGNGLTGAAVSYELARQGLSVLLVDQALEPENATRYSYAGIPYWSGTDPLTRQLCQEGITRHRQLSEELDQDTELRELDLLLTLSTDTAKEKLANQFSQFGTPPRWVSPQQAKDLEPLLNAAAIAGAYTVRHGHVSPGALIRAYNRAFQRLRGTLVIAPVTGLVRVKDKVTGLTTAEQAYPARQVLVAAGGLSRQLLRSAGVQIPLYYTLAELIETPPLDLTLRTLIMPADSQRSALEAVASQPATDALWDQPGHELTAPILDSGAIQFQDGHLCIGQISRTLTGPDATVDAAASEDALRQAVATVVPALQAVPGTWHQVQVSFSRDGKPLVGSVPGLTGLQVFTGFSSPFVYVPPVAERFAKAVVGPGDDLLVGFRPGRFDGTVKA
jgi:glycine/D-amino acid oxidase-like deaminating enzyme